MNFQTFDRSDFFLKCLEKKLLRFKIRLFFLVVSGSRSGTRECCDAQSGYSGSRLGTYANIFDPERDTCILFITDIAWLLACHDHSIHIWDVLHLCEPYVLFLAQCYVTVFYIKKQHKTKRFIATWNKPRCIDSVLWGSFCAHNQWNSYYFSFRRSRCITLSKALQALTLCNSHQRV